MKNWHKSPLKCNAFSITAVGLGHLLTWSGSYIHKTSLWSILSQTEHPNNVYLKKKHKMHSFRTKIVRSAYKIGQKLFAQGILQSRPVKRIIFVHNCTSRALAQQAVRALCATGPLLQPHRIVRDPRGQNLRGVDVGWYTFLMLLFS